MWVRGGSLSLSVEVREGSWSFSLISRLPRNYWHNGLVHFHSEDRQRLDYVDIVDA